MVVPLDAYKWLCDESNRTSTRVSRVQRLIQCIKDQNPSLDVVARWAPNVDIIYLQDRLRGVETSVSGDVLSKDLPNGRLSIIAMKARQRLEGLIKAELEEQRRAEYGEYTVGERVPRVANNRLPSLSYLEQLVASSISTGRKLLERKYG